MKRSAHVCFININKLLFTLFQIFIDKVDNINTSIRIFFLHEYTEEQTIKYALEI
jgi:hypothetical protein